MDKQKVLMYSKGNYIQYPVITHDGKKYKKECLFVYNWITLLYSRDWHGIVNQLYFNKKKFKENNMELHSMLCGSLDGRWVCRRMDACTRMAESLCCSSETITTLLIGYFCLVAKLCPTVCDPMDWSLPGSSVHGISQARILEWVAIL